MTGGRARSPPRGVVALDIAVLAVLLIGSYWLVNPIGAFPLNDDWAYTRTAQIFAATGEFRPTDWGSMTLLTNILWGSLFCLHGACSFTALRISSLAMAVLGSAGAYLLVSQMQGRRALALLAGYGAGFNPFFYLLSFTFMTDVTFFALLIFSHIFFVRALRRPGLAVLAAATALAIAATLSRQIGLCAPMAYCLVRLRAGPWRMRNLAAALLPLTATAGALAVFQHMMAARHLLPARYNEAIGTATTMLAQPGALALLVGTHVLQAAMYVGLFCVPALLLLLVIAPALRTRAVLRAMSGVGALILAAGLLGIAQGHKVMMPLLENCISIAGMGPLSLRDVLILGAPLPSMLPLPLWLGVTLMAVAGAAALSVAVFVGVGETGLLRRGSDVAQWRHAAALLLVVSTALYLAPVLLTRLYDRYTMVPPPLLLASFCVLARGGTIVPPRLPKWALAGAGVMTLAFAMFAVAGTHDYLGWNRARWALLDKLTGPEHIARDEIDGGFEFNGFYGYDPAYQPSAHKSWWWVRDPVFIISFGPIAGYETHASQAFARWLPPGAGQVLALRRMDGH